MKKNRKLFFSLILVTILFGGFWFVQAQHDCDCCVGAPNPSLNTACTPTGSGYDSMSVDAGQLNHIYGGYTDEQCNSWCSGGGGGDNIGRCSVIRYYCPGTNCSGTAFSGVPTGCAPTCTYVSAVKTWSACENGLSYATEVVNDTNPNILATDPACVDAPVVRSCSTCFDSTEVTTAKPLSQIFSISTMPNLVAYWPFDGNANDIKGSNNGITYNGVLNTTGKFNKAYSFDSVDDYIEIPNSFYIDSNPLINDYSFSVWIKTVGVPGVSNRKPIFGTMDPLGTGFSLHLFNPENGGIGNELSVWNNMISPTEAYSGDSILDDGTWKNVIYNKKGGTGSMYINGEKVYEGPGSEISFGSNLRIGAAGTGWFPTWLFSGLIDDMAVWSRSLTDCEIKSIYTGTDVCLPTCVDCNKGVWDLSLNTSLISMWTFDKADGSSSTTLKDMIGNNDGSPIKVEQITSPIKGEAYHFPSIPAGCDPCNQDDVSIVDIANEQNFDFDANENITISSFFKLDNVSDPNMIIASKSSHQYNAVTPVATNYQVSASKNQITFLQTHYQFGDYVTFNEVYYAPINIAAETWHQVVVTYTFGVANSMKVYLDGNLISGSWSPANYYTNPMGGYTLVTGGNGTTAYFVNDGLLKFGWHPDGGTKGSLDEIGIWNRILSPSEVGLLYGYYVSDPSCPTTVSCGTADGSKTFSIPTENLCSDGSKPAVFGNGPWNWVCGDSVYSSTFMNGIKSMWTFNAADGSNANTAVDITGRNNGRVINAPLKIGQGIKGDTYEFYDNQSIEVSNSDDFNFGGDDFTMSYWIKSNTTAGWEPPHPLSFYGSMTGWWQAVGNSTRLGDPLNFVGYDGGGSSSYPTGTYFTVPSVGASILNGSWNNVLIRRQEDTFSLFVNCSLKGTMSSSAVFRNNLGKLYIGNIDPAHTASSGYNAPVNGLMDEVGIWNRALSDSEVTQLCESYNNSTSATSTSCSADIIANPLVATCLAISDNEFVATSTVTWMASPSGGTGGPYTYSWTFSGGGTADNVSSVEKIYTVPGYKYATVSISDASTTISVPCTGVGNPGDGDGKGIEIFDPSTITPVLDTALNCTFVTQPLTPVKVNNNATWTISTTPACPSCLRDWTMDSNGTKTPLLVGGASDTLNKIITTTGMKTITAQVFSTNRLKFGNPCIATTTVTQSGVIQEQ